jgi:hypothetical protein
MPLLVKDDVNPIDMRLTKLLVEGPPGDFPGSIQYSTAGRRAVNRFLDEGYRKLDEPF